MNVAVLNKVFAPKYLNTFEEGDIVVYVLAHTPSVGVVKEVLYDEDRVSVRFWNPSQNCFYDHPFRMTMQSLVIIGVFKDFRR